MSAVGLHLSTLHFKVPSVRPVSYHPSNRMTMPDSPGQLIELSIESFVPHGICTNFTFNIPTLVLGRLG